jgi:hypothetical protein
MLEIQSVYLDGLHENSRGDDSLSKTLIVKNLNYIFSHKNVLVTGKNREHCISLPNSAGLEFVHLKAPTKGALATSLLSIDYLEEDLPIVLVPTNSFVDREVLIKFLNKAIDTKVSASTLCIETDNPNYSYLRVHNDKVIEFVEKRVAGKYGTTGIFYLQNKRVFLESAQWALINSQQTNGVFYIAPALNYAISMGLEVSYEVILENQYTHIEWN